MADWDNRFMDLANHVAGWSKDRSTKVAAVITDENHRILSIGYNGFPSGCNDQKEERHQRPAKYLYTEHAERNAIYNAARNGIRLEGATIYIPFCPCVDCARAIIQSGIKRVVAGQPKQEDYERLKATFHFETSIELFYESGVIFNYY